MNELINFVFFDRDWQELASMGLANRDVAYERAQNLANEHGQTVVIAEIIETVEPDDSVVSSI